MTDFKYLGPILIPNGQAKDKIPARTGADRDASFAWQSSSRIAAKYTSKFRIYYMARKNDENGRVHIIAHMLSLTILYKVSLAIYFIVLLPP